MMHPKAVATGDFSVCRLCEVPSLAPVLAKAHAREWGHLYVHWNESVALSDLAAEGANAGIPVTWLAHHSWHGPMGSVSLVMDDLPDYPDLNPWLASLYVFPEFRGRGLGRILVQRALAAVQQLQFPNIYLFTEDQVPFFSKFGFTIRSPVQANGHAVNIMKWTNPIAPTRSGQEIADGQ